MFSPARSGSALKLYSSRTFLKHLSCKGSSVGSLPQPPTLRRKLVFSFCICNIVLSFGHCNENPSVLGGLRLTCGLPGQELSHWLSGKQLLCLRSRCVKVKAVQHSWVSMTFERLSPLLKKLWHHCDQCGHWAHQQLGKLLSLNTVCCYIQNVTWNCISHRRDNLSVLCRYEFLPQRNWTHVHISACCWKQGTFAY